MFSTGHLIFIAISLFLIAFGVIMCLKIRPKLSRMINICFALSIISEIVKVLSVIEILPVVEPMVENGMLIYRETGQYAPYIQAEHLPFELCSLQILFMFLSLIIKKDENRKKLYSTMYGTSIIGGTIAVFMASIAPEFETTAAFLSAPRAWQFFLYHAMIIVVGIYIGISDESDIRFSDLKWMIVIVLGLDFLSFYLNSMMSVPYYVGDNIVGLAYGINYFSSYNNPLGIVMSTKGQYFIYLLIRIVIALILIPIVYLPLKLKKTNNE